MTLEGRAALVTGGSRGIGRAIALRLAAVAVNYRSRKDEAERTVEEITALGGRAIALQADVADPGAAQRLVDETTAGLGGLHILVNNAGVARDGLIFDQSPEDWWEVLRVNIGGVYHCTRAAAGHFMSQRDGNIINISSVMGEGGWIGQSNYSASKGAVNSFTRVAAVELARFEVRVNAVLAGFTETELIGGLLEKDGGRSIKRQLPLREFATPEQVAGAVSFLAGEDSSYITGELLRVDGGWAGQLGLGRAK
ncbi:3-oxoacyl-ACP reductase family protein [Streptomyces sp. ITFR-6]|uniref:SDR family NAD(P)-dependent oxidoreductase n=1 Tax=Streptomyces sp. ITFR-6 TaxID=3075197 RepID=UPI00288A7A0B|nr:3-oxoacyl-ACP reductase family protein [Streptomyces sp. ITFR-6]WNI31143.1 3-oxoacyl-ACP reductase family protein [Streptomyces sp. ITFR-6]